MLFLIILDRIIYKHIVKSDLSIIVDPNQAEIRYPVDPNIVNEHQKQHGAKNQS